MTDWSVSPNQLRTCRGFQRAGALGVRMRGAVFSHSTRRLHGKTDGQRTRSPDPVKGRSSPCLGAAQRERSAVVAFCGVWGSLIGGVCLRVPPPAFENSDAIGMESCGPLKVSVIGAWRVRRVARCARAR